ncbi:kinase-like domain-containing protein [Syncephalis pseudoplumigaleata]|uniref:Kinase-like domain-containing protein n=1 Tax=Syncephalis pseudoplumigaleata TaxID=1712513 RepID=A0A4P9YRF1_9FUNG|nr:kinase-like domain-containing protein [Syncephalis pseudoplumigaleata]|eukprot:RKP22463.1 kinase-like domain-containing protein [Syncephalis pseudoplumigaleata]
MHTHPAPYQPSLIRPTLAIVKASFLSVVVATLALTTLVLADEDAHKREFTSMHWENPKYMEHPKLGEYSKYKKGEWIKQKSGVYTAEASVDGAPAFLKCTRDSKEYSREAQFYEQLSKPIKPASEICRRIGWASDMFFKKEVDFPTDNQYGCIVMFSESKVKEVYDYIDTTSKHILYWHTMHLIQQMVVGTAYLHCQNIIHADIKPENMLVHHDKEGIQRIKIIDFGVSLDMPPNGKGRMECNTNGYCGPELFKNRDGIVRMTKADGWALGAVIYIYLMQENVYVLPRELLYSGRNKAIYNEIVKRLYKKETYLRDAVRRRIRSTYSDIPKRFALAIDLMEKLMRRKPKDRKSPLDLIAEYADLQIKDKYLGF